MSPDAMSARIAALQAEITAEDAKVAALAESLGMRFNAREK
jgi:uncharacterized small protein (DUF1192 family)